MRNIIYFLFCIVFFQQTAASSCEDEGLNRAISTLKTAIDHRPFPNITEFIQCRGRAAYTIVQYYEKELKKAPERREELTKRLAEYARPQQDGGLLIKTDYLYDCIPITFGISLGETFERLDLAKPLMIQTHTYGLKEYFRGYLKHWEVCPHRHTHPYRPDWQKLQENKSLYQCCFNIIPLFQEHYDPEEASIHHHFLFQSFLHAQNTFTTNGFDEALDEIKNVLKKNNDLKIPENKKLIIVSSSPTPQQDHTSKDDDTQKNTLESSQ